MRLVGYLSDTFDLFHVGHLNILRYAKEHCDYLVVGVATDELIHKTSGMHPVIPFNERLEIVRSVRSVDSAIADATGDWIDAWGVLQFDCLFDRAANVVSSAEKLGAGIAIPDVEVVHLKPLPTTSSASLRDTLESINRLARDVCFDVDPASLAIRRALQ